MKEHMELVESTSTQLTDLKQFIIMLKEQKEIYEQEYGRISEQISILEKVQASNPLNFDKRYSSLQKQAKLQEEILLVGDYFENDIEKFDSKVKTYQSGVNDFIKNLSNQFNTSIQNLRNKILKFSGLIKSDR